MLPDCIVVRDAIDDFLSGVLKVKCSGRQILSAIVSEILLGW